MRYSSLLLLLCCWLGAQSQSLDPAMRKTDSILVEIQKVPARYDTAWVSRMSSLIYANTLPSRDAELLPTVYKMLEVANTSGSAQHRIMAYMELGLNEGLPEEENLRYMDSVMALLPSIQKPSLRMYQAADVASQIYSMNRKFIRQIGAIDQWSRLADIDGDYTGKINNELKRASIYNQVGLYPQAKALILKGMYAIPANDTSSSAGWAENGVYNMLISVFKREHQYDSAYHYALKYLNIAQKRFEQKPETIWHLKTYLDGLHNAVVSAWNNQSFTEFQQHLASFHSVLTQYVPQSWRFRIWHQWTGVHYYHQKQYPEAIKAYELARQSVRSREVPYDNSLIYAGLGKSYQALGKYQEALEAYQEGYDLAAKDESFSLTFGHLLELSDSLAHLAAQMGKKELSLFYTGMSNKYRTKLLDDNSLRDYARYEVEQQERSLQELTTQSAVQQRRTLWISLGFLVALMFAGFAFWQLRLRRKLYRELEQAQQSSERLLLNIMPQEVANRLKQSHGTLADAYEEVSVIFIDIVGFTELAAKQSPEEVVAMLNQVFVYFDRLTDQFGLEKIKTIGDCYMAVAGLPERVPDHLERCLQMGLAVVQTSDRFWIDGQKLQFRIGIDTGPVVAGVIGEKRFLYDLWGDVVNTASRMESNGMPGAIHTTENVFERMQGKFQFEERGWVDIKGKGRMRTYLCEGLKI